MEMTHYEDCGDVRQAVADLLMRIFEGREDKEPLSDEDRADFSQALEDLASNVA